MLQLTISTKPPPFLLGAGGPSSLCDLLGRGGLLLDNDVENLSSRPRSLRDASPEPLELTSLPDRLAGVPPDREGAESLVFARTRWSSFARVFPLSNSSSRLGCFRPSYQPSASGWGSHAL